MFLVSILGELDNVYGWLMIKDRILDLKSGFCKWF